MSNSSLQLQETTPLLDYESQTKFSRRLNKLPWMWIIKVVIAIATIAILISALVVRGDADKTDCIVLGLVSGVILLYIVSPFVPALNPDVMIEKLDRPLSVVGSRRGSLVCTFLVIALMGLVCFTLPVGAGTSRLARAQSLLGLVVFLFFLFATSNNRKAIEWRTVWVGLLLQFLLALFVLRTWVGYHIFSWLSATISAFLGYSSAGYEFLFGNPPSNFAGNVFPAIIFFCATVELLYYIGFLQAVIRKFATFFLYLMGTSGAESVVAAASPFIGQGENALLVRPFVKDMTKSEIHQIMASGFATISGSVLFGYISLGVSPQYLITAAIMSVPCAISLSKIRYPETDTPATKGEIRIVPQEEGHKPNNPLQALGHGAKTGMKIVLIIAASLIAILSLLATINAVLTWIGHFYGIAQLTLQSILKYPFYPIAWLMGVAWHDIPDMSELLALKLVANEFAAYEQLMLIKAQISPRSELIISYALCGFANFSSIGIQIGIFGAIAPTRLADFSSLALSAMLTGALSTCFSAVIAGMLF